MWCDINSNYISGVLNRRYTLTTCVNPYSLKLFLWNGNWINNISSHKKIGVIRFVIIEINLCTMKLNQNSMWIMMKIQEKNILITTSNKFQKNRIENIWNWLTEMTIGSILTSHQKIGTICFSYLSLLKRDFVQWIFVKEFCEPCVVWFQQKLHFRSNE